MAQELERVRLLLGEEALQKLQNSTVLVAGIGGVGSYAVEGLARTGVGHLILIDKDTVDVTNLNRQIMADHDTIGRQKCAAMAARIHSYAPDCVVEGMNQLVDSSCLRRLTDCDFAIDAVDTVAAKLDFIQACHDCQVPFVSATGMGNRLDPSRIRIVDLMETSGDPLAKAVRVQARKRGIAYPVPVLFSSELPRLHQNTVVNPDGRTRKERIPPASTIFVPAAAGLLAASYAVRVLIGDLQWPGTH